MCRPVYTFIVIILLVNTLNYIFYFNCNGQRIGIIIICSLSLSNSTYHSLSVHLSLSLFNMTHSCSLVQSTHYIATTAGGTTGNRPTAGYILQSHHACHSTNFGDNVTQNSENNSS